MECPICLEDMNDDIFILSCNHKIHYQCFMTFFIKTQGNIFINCPLCREMNYNNQKPSTNTKENIKKYSIELGRCSATTKDGKRCKKKCLLMNNGFCSVHNKNILKSEHLDYLCEVLYYLTESCNSVKTKIVMLDFAKHMINNDSTINTIPKLQSYLFRYYNYNNNLKISSVNSLYEYYHLNPPPDEWIQKCIKNNKLL